MTTTALDVQREMLLLVTARVRDAYLRRPLYVDATLDVASVCREMAVLNVTAVLVKDGERLGLFTTTDLRDAVVRGRSLDSVPVRDAARFELITVEPECELFEALWLMERHRVHRLIVCEGTRVLGVLAQLDLVSFVASHSHIVALQIDEASSVADLKLAATRIDAMIALLHDGGIKIERIARLVNELNARLFARLWSLLAPPDLVANSCLVVMGSEGRGEQIVKTDQDNALVLRDGFAAVGLEDVAARFNGALVELGYPPCPGDIMLTNPLWRQPLAGFRETIRDWLFSADPQGPMRLAIFFDAAAVAGDARLLADAREHLYDIFAGNDAFLARFASAVDQFSAGGGWWSWLTTRRDDSQLDLKKIGTFPIVHGVRVLALQHRLHEVGTAARLRVLVEKNAVDAELARDLIDALHCLMGMKLTHQLRQRAAGEVPGNLVRPADLGTLERDALTHALGIVKRFRALLAQRFRLDAL
ncbi:MAG TPA: putative nucleotidyltransferase substrate binding domain-containing protein [Caldimonas sp.]|nr:putative nucleotidyltransferase substrate binding domain-containing protein [Caldimonas sp.]